MKKMLSNRMLSIVAVIAVLACAFVPAASAAGKADKAYTVAFSTGTTATVPAGEDFVFAIVCQPPTDITEIKVSGGTLTAEKSTPGGPSTPQGIINGLWVLSEITGDVTITLVLNTQEGADLPAITIGRAEAEAAVASSGGPGGGAPPEGGPGGAPPEGGPPGGGMPEGGGAPPAGAPQN
jgi:hypothetical protein